MTFRPIYTPRTRAREYCDLAVNIYDSCPHGCTYCYARAMAKRFGKPWGDTVSTRPGIAEAVRKQLAGMQGQAKKIMLCFTCDPYPIGCDTTATRDVIEAIKASGNHVQILTKGDETAQRDFDLLDCNDSFGVTWSGGGYCDEKRAGSHIKRRDNLRAAKEHGTRQSPGPVNGRGFFLNAPCSAAPCCTAASLVRSCSAPACGTAPQSGPRPGAGGGVAGVPGDVGDF